MTFDKWWDANMAGKGVDAAKPLVKIAWDAAIEFEQAKCAQLEMYLGVVLKLHLRNHGENRLLSGLESGTLTPLGVARLLTAKCEGKS